MEDIEQFLKVDFLELMKETNWLEVYDFFSKHKVEMKTKKNTYLVYIDDVVYGMSMNPVQALVQAKEEYEFEQDWKNIDIDKFLD